MQAQQAVSTKSGSPHSSSEFWTPVILASLVLMICMGTRQTIGLFVHPLVSSTGLSIAEMSMALAIGQLMWGVFIPLFGAWADNSEPWRVLLAGALLLAFGQIATMFATSFWPMTLAQGLLSPAGAAAGSFSILFSIMAARLPAARASVASGIVNAGGSVGQFAFAPVVQALLSLRGIPAALLFLAGSAIASLIPSWLLCRNTNPAAARNKALSARQAEASAGLTRQLRTALANPSYLLLHAGFFTCGFHVAFLTTHLPGEIGLCGHAASVSAMSISLIGLCNIGGSIAAGYLGKLYRMKNILVVLYALRALMILAYMLAPKTEMTFYVFACAIGLTWLATVPPTSGIVGKLFGTRYLATLFGLTLFTHQVGAFLGAWFGGLAMHYSGNLAWVWYLDALLALAAAAANYPIREPAPVRQRY